ERFLRMFTFLPIDQIVEAAKAHADDPGSRSGQKLLAREATRIVHGDSGVRAAEQATGVLFGGTPVTELSDEALAMAFEQAPTTEFPRSELDETIGLLDLMTRVGASRSNGEARRLVEQGGVRLNDHQITDSTYRVSADDLATTTTVLLRVGMKRQYLARVVVGHARSEL